MTPSVAGSTVSTGPSQKSPGSRISELDGLRGIAILMVLFFHFTTYMMQLRGWPRHPRFVLYELFQVGWTGVDLFFVLSGYLITGILVDSVGHANYYRNFIIRRSLRIFPLYYACLIFYAFVTYWPGPVRWVDYLHAGGALWYVGYLGNVKAFLDNAWPGAAMLTPLWSLQVEEQFYLSFPLLVWILARRRLAQVLAISVVAALALRIALTLGMPKNLLGPYTLMPARLDPLAIGGLIAIAQRERPQWLQSRKVGWLTAVAFLTFAGVFISETPWKDLMEARLKIDCCQFGGMRTLGYTAADLAFAGLVVMLINGRHASWQSFCRVRVLVWIGTISYGLYLLHIPALTIADRWLRPALGIPAWGYAEVFLALATAIALATVSWYGFESRILKLKNRFTVR